MRRKKKGNEMFPKNLLKATLNRWQQHGGNMKKAQKGTKQSNNTLQCTNVAVYPFKSDGKTKAFARIELNGQLVLTGLRIVNGVNGYFVSYPIDPRNKEEDYHSIYYPLGRELREHIEQAILAKYAEIAGEAIQAEEV